MTRFTMYPQSGDTNESSFYWQTKESRDLLTLTQGGFYYTTSRLKILESYTIINIYFISTHINQLYSSMVSSYPGIRL